MKSRTKELEPTVWGEKKKQRKQRSRLDMESEWKLNACLFTEVGRPRLSCPWVSVVHMSPSLRLCLHTHRDKNATPKKKEPRKIVEIKKCSD